MLVFLDNSIFALYESWEKSQIFCCQECLTSGFLKERVDQFNDLVFGNCCLNRTRIVLQDTNQTLLNVRSVDVVRMLEEKIDPPGKVNSVILVSNGYLFEKLVSALKYFWDLVSDGSVFWGFTVSFDVLERLIQDEENFNQEFSHSCFDEDFLDCWVGSVAWWTNVFVVCSVDFTGQELNDVDDVSQLIVVKGFEEMVGVN